MNNIQVLRLDIQEYTPVGNICQQIININKICYSFLFLWPKAVKNKADFCAICAMQTKFIFV